MTVIIPTLNERGNVGRLIKRLLRLYKGIKIIVVDDDSVDGTKSEVKRISRYNHNVLFLAKPNNSIKGITSSILYGLKKTKTERIVVMDADLQHPTNKVSKIYEGLNRYMIVVGVRTSVKGWGIYRKVVSIVISKFVVIIFKIKGYKTSKDLMSGFFGIRTKDFKKLVSQHRKRYVMEGYKVFLDTLKLIDKNTPLLEIPYKTFHKRKRGISKTNARVIINIIRSCFR